MPVKKSETKFRQGKKPPEFNPVPTLLSHKTYKKYNIIVGEDSTQQRFVEQLLNLPCISKELLMDEDLLVDDSSKLFRVETSQAITLSPKVKEMTAIWSLDPIEKGSAGANAIVRYAATLLGMDKPDRDRIERTADLLAGSSGVGDIRVALWSAVGLLTGAPPPDSGKRWPQPWESPQLWFDIPGVSPEYRLNSLYWDLVSYVLLQRDDEGVLKKAEIRISPSKTKVLKALKLDYTKVYNTLEILDLWRTQHTDSFICAFKIAIIWKK